MPRQYREVVISEGFPCKATSRHLGIQCGQSVLETGSLRVACKCDFTTSSNSELPDAGVPENDQQCLFPRYRLYFCLLVD